MKKAKRYAWGWETRKTGKRVKKRLYLNFLEVVFAWSISSKRIACELCGRGECVVCLGEV